MEEPRGKTGRKEGSRAGGGSRFVVGKTTEGRATAGKERREPAGDGEGCEGMYPAPGSRRPLWS